MSKNRGLLPAPSYLLVGLLTSDGIGLNVIVLCYKAGGGSYDP